MSEKGFLHTVRRSTLGRNAEEHESHIKNLRELKNEVKNATQATIDDLNNRYQNSEVSGQIEKKHGAGAATGFIDELKGLQVTLIDAKGEYLHKRENDEINDIEDIKEDVDLWRQQMEKLVEESAFRELAESYGVWGHEPVKNIQTGIRGKVIDIRRKAA